MVKLAQTIPCSWIKFESSSKEEENEVKNEAWKCLFSKWISNYLNGNYNETINNEMFLRPLNPIHIGSDKSETFVNIDPTSF